MNSLEILVDIINNFERTVSKNRLYLFKSLRQFKEDLEVLEIFKKRIKCKNNMGSHGFKNSHKHFIFILYNHLEEHKEDFKKVEKYILSNKVGNSNDE